MLLPCDQLFSHYNINLFEYIKKAVDKRKAEFLAGRYAAKHALSSYGIDDYTVMIGKHRNPIWPADFNGSITHSNNIAISAIAPKGKVRALGIDIEKCLSLDTINSVKRSIITTEEEELLKSSTLDFPQSFTLTFSAKESLFKALYPSVGRYFDFSAAKIIQLLPKSGKITLQLMENLSDEFNQGFCLDASFSINCDDIFTLVYLPQA